MADISRLVLEVDSSGVVKATGNLSIFNKEAKKSEKQASSLDDVFNQFNVSAMAGAAGVLVLFQAFQKLTSGLISFGQQSIKTYAHFESMQKGLETYFHSAEKGKAVFEDLRKYSNETTFGVDELSGASTQLLNVGVQADNLKKVLGQLGDVAGGNKQKFAELVDVYAKINATGKATSMQLQQLAMRGVPIYDMLKKMGVQGSATSEDIKKAFETMTSADGQFYNAMNNINDTIEGKEGFIQDYFKEFMTNFADATGIADVYKGALDLIREALGGISDWLLTINENPISKALLQGTLTAALMTLVGVVGVTLLAALKKVNKELGITVVLKSIIDPKTLGLAVAVGAIAGVAVAVASVNKELGKAKDAVDDLKKMGGYSDGGMLPKVSTSTAEQVAELESKLENAKKQKEIAQNSYNVLKKGMSLEELQAGESPRAKAMYSQLKFLNAAEAQVKSYQKSLDFNKTQLANSNMVKQFNTEKQRIIDEINNAYEDSTLGQTEAKIQETSEKIEKIRDDLILSLADVQIKDIIPQETIDKAEKTIFELENQIRKLEGQTEKKRWKDKIKQMTGLDIANSKMQGMNGNDLFEKYKAQFENEKAKQKEISDFLYGKDTKKSKDAQANWLSKSAETFQSWIQELLSDTNLDDAFTVNDNYIKGMSELATETGNSADKLRGLGDIIARLQNMATDAFESGDAGKAIGIGIGANVLSQSTDFANFQQGADTFGGAMGGVVGMFISSISDMIMSVDGIEKVLNPVSTILQQFQPIIQALFEPAIQLIDVLSNFASELNDLILPIVENVMNLITPYLEMFASILEVVIAILEPFMQMLQIVSKALQVLSVPIKLVTNIIQMLANTIGKLVEPIAEALSWLAKGIDAIFGWIDDLFGVKKEKEKNEEKNEIDLTNAYKDLIKAMRENEEEYYHRRMSINAKSYNAGATGVHDMILSPYGQFSTDPDDYIIATKKPENLGGGGYANVTINIQNTMADSAKVDVTQGNDGQTLFIRISQAVANDYANGKNGWDGAIMARQIASQGRSVVG